MSSQVIHDIGNVFRVAVPMLLYFSTMWTGTFLGCRRAGMRYADAVVQVRAHAPIQEGQHRTRVRSLGVCIRCCTPLLPCALCYAQRG